MTPRLLPRKRPRQASVDFSRLWWLVETEAAFEFCQHHLLYCAFAWERTNFRYRGLAYLGKMRAHARRCLEREEVIV